MMKNSIYLLTALALAGCGDKATNSRPEGLLAGTDFEGVAGWNGDAPTPLSLTREKAHSGMYSMRVGPEVEYASGFIGTLGKLNSTRIGKIQVKGWVYAPGGETTAAIVTQIVDPATPNAKPVLWEALPLDKTVKTRNEWVEVDKTVVLPANVTPGMKLYVYLWRGPAPAVAYIDDMQILKAE